MLLDLLVGGPLTWEVFNVVVKVAVIMGSVVMFPRNRFYTQLFVTVVSLGAHAIVRPYKDKAGNIIVVLFCVCDIIGMSSAKFPALQILFVLCLILTLSAVSYFAFRAARGRVQDIQAAAAAASATASQTRNAGSSPAYGPLEKKLLFPVLVVVGLGSKIMMAVCKVGLHPKNTQHSRTVVVPSQIAPPRIREDSAQQENDESNRDAAQKLRELREAHGADSEEYRAERERIVSVAAGTKADSVTLAE
jgi:hypothetical protein